MMALFARTDLTAEEARASATSARSCSSVATSFRFVRR